MSHNRNRNITPLAELNRVTTPKPVQAPAPTNVRNRDLDPMTNQPWRPLDPWADAPQTIKAKAESKAKLENMTVTEKGKVVVIDLDVKRLRPTKAGSADIYATGTATLSDGTKVNLNLTRHYTASVPSPISSENGKLEILSQGSVRITLTPKYIGLSASQKTDLYAKVNGNFEIQGRGVFHISLSAYKAITQGKDTYEG